MERQPLPLASARTHTETEKLLLVSTEGPAVAACEVAPLNVAAVGAACPGPDSSRPATPVVTLAALAGLPLPEESASEVEPAGSARSHSPTGPVAEPIRQS